MGSFLGASPASTRPLPRTPKVGINLTPFLHPQPEGLTSLLCFKLVEELGWAAWPQGLLNGVYVLMCGMVPRPPTQILSHRYLFGPCPSEVLWPSREATVQGTLSWVPLSMATVQAW